MRTVRRPRQDAGTPSEEADQPGSSRAEPTGMGGPHGQETAQDPRGLPSLPRRHPRQPCHHRGIDHRRATYSETGPCGSEEGRAEKEFPQENLAAAYCPETGTSGSGRRPLEKDPHRRAPRQRPTGTPLCGRAPLGPWRGHPGHAGRAARRGQDPRLPAAPVDVPRNIFRVLCPAPLCGRRRSTGAVADAGERPGRAGFTVT